jgi:hypothetical protein
MSLNVLEKYEQTFGVKPQSYETREQAEQEANRLGGTGAHSHTQEDGSIVYMPFNTHAEYENAVGVDEVDIEFRTEMRDKIRKRMLQLLEASTTNNGF